MGADSNRDAFVAIEGARQFQLPIVGPFTSIGPIVTGPWYWWQLIFSRIIIPTPYTPWIYMGLLSMILIIIFYRIGVLLESEIFGLILSLIVTFSPEQIVTAYQLNNPVIIGFYSTLILWIFLEIIIKHRQAYWGYLFGIACGITITTHYQTIPLFVLLFAVLIFRRFKTFYQALFGFIITLVPLIFFESNNHWFNTRNMIDYYLYGQYRIWVSARWLTFITDFWPRFWSFVIGGTPYFGAFFMILTPIVLVKKFINENEKKLLLLVIGITFLIGVIFVRYYRGEKYFGYLRFFHPYIFLFTGYVLYAFYRKKLVFGFIATILYLYLVIPSSIKVLQADTLTVEISSVYNKVISEWGNKEYAIYDCPSTDINRGRGLSLFFVLRGNYNPNSNNKLLYFYGHCSLPNFVKENKTINPDLYKQQDLFPRIDIFYDVSAASEAAILEKGGVKFTTSNEYHRAAKWWFDEKP